MVCAVSRLLTASASTDLLEDLVLCSIELAVLQKKVEKDEKNDVVPRETGPSYRLDFLS